MSGQYHNRSIVVRLCGCSMLCARHLISVRETMWNNKYSQNIFCKGCVVYSFLRIFEPVPSKFAELNFILIHCTLSSLVFRVGSGRLKLKSLKAVLNVSVWSYDKVCHWLEKSKLMALCWQLFPQRDLFSTQNNMYKIKLRGKPQIANFIFILTTWLCVKLDFTQSRTKCSSQEQGNKSIVQLIHCTENLV